jgi:methionyl-tRNA formyltransferase
MALCAYGAFEILGAKRNKLLGHLSFKVGTISCYLLLLMSEAAKSKIPETTRRTVCLARILCYTLSMLSLVFAGSPAIAVPALRLIADSGYAVAAVLTNPDTAKGRSAALTSTPVARCAEELGLPIIKSARIDISVMDSVRQLSPSLLVTFAYGALFPLEFLALFPLGGINCHPSLLPKYRGAAPIQEAILKRDTVTGITIQYLAEKMDEGDIIIQEEIPLDGKETTESLGALAAERGAVLLVRAISLIERGAAERRRQKEGEASYCRKTGKEEGRIDWTRAAPEIDAQIRAFTPWPLCRTCAPEKELLILEAHTVAAETRTEAENTSVAATAPGTVIGVDNKEGILIQTGRGVLAATRLQWKSKKALNFRDFLNGAKGFIGTMLK